MSMTQVKPYFVDRAKACELIEHKDGFNQDNIPKIDKAFHVLLGEFVSRRTEARVQEMNCPVTVTFWLKSGKNVSETIDKAVQKGESLVKETLKTDTRLGTLIKNVVFDSMKVDASTASNDNIVKTTISFTAVIVLAL